MAEDSPSCIFDFIFLVWQPPNRKMGSPLLLQEEGRRRTRERFPLAGLPALRLGACSVFAFCPKLEPLLERFGLQPSRLGSLQV